MSLHHDTLTTVNWKCSNIHALWQVSFFPLIKLLLFKNNILFFMNILFKNYLCGVRWEYIRRLGWKKVKEFVIWYLRRAEFSIIKYYKRLEVSMVRRNCGNSFVCRIFLNEFTYKLNIWAVDHMGYVLGEKSYYYVQFLCRWDTVCSSHFDPLSGWILTNFM